MATIRAYTTIEQSRKLAKILPIESADMEYLAIKESSKLVGNIPFVKDDSEVEDSAYSHTYDRIACWSLAALLGVLPILDNRSPVIPKTFDGKYRVTYHSTAYEKAILTSDYDNPIDACVAMIERLHELNLL